MTNGFIRFKKWFNSRVRVLFPFLFLLLRIRLAWFYRAAERYNILLWAGIVGILGGLSSILFRKILDLLAEVFTGYSGDMVDVFQYLSVWQKIATPAFGGIAAGLVLYAGTRFAADQKNTTDYMEAVVLGEGTLSIKMSLTKIFSSMFSFASGASIGREGPMVQLSSLLASIAGRRQNWSVSKKRIIIACGASAGIASAYNAPIAGALFVAEIVIGTIAIETLGPLLFASVLATQMVRFLLDEAPLYAIPPFYLNSGFELFPYLALGLLIGLAAPFFLRILRGSEMLFSRTNLPVYIRTGIGGLIVGIIAVYYPQVCGNGYSVVSGILQEQWLWSSLAIVLILKLVATGASFGSGAVGGVFTPTLFMGAGIGYLFGHLHQFIGFGANPVPGAFALTGMAMFLAATTHAPLMAILMIFEMTMDYQLILPLMLGCVVAHLTSQGIEPESIYSSSLEKKGAVYFARKLAMLTLPDLVKPNPPRVKESAPFNEITRHFLINTFRYLYVVNKKGVYQGSICLDDVKEYLNTPSLNDLVIARDLLAPVPVSLKISSTLEEALEKFADNKQHVERLPVVADDTMVLVGSLAKTDIILALSDQLPGEKYRNSD